jgi:uncharacterized hydrophobic protein (TIGR00271 family)
MTADLAPASADTALQAASALGIPPVDVALLRLDAIQPGQHLRSDVVWADLLGMAGQYAVLEVRFMVFMVAEGVIAAYGVIFANPILIVGAMAVSPDLLPIAATCIGIVLRRRRLVVRASVTLVAGLGVAAAVACALTAALVAGGLTPVEFEADPSVPSGLTTVNSSTFLVAFVAGIAAMLALETRASSAVGVAISVTTIPASAYIGVAAGVGQASKASGALAVLAINVVFLIGGGTLALLAQRALNRRRQRQEEALVR